MVKRCMIVYIVIILKWLVFWCFFSLFWILFFVFIFENMPLFDSFRNERIFSSLRTIDCIFKECIYNSRKHKRIIELKCFFFVWKKKCNEACIIPAIVYKQDNRTIIHVSHITPQWDYPKYVECEHKNV